MSQDSGSTTLTKLLCLIDARRAVDAMHVHGAMTLPVKDAVFTLNAILVYMVNSTYFCQSMWEVHRSMALHFASVQWSAWCRYWVVTQQQVVQDFNTAALLCIPC